MRLTVLASGSSGNALLVDSGGTRLLIDAGLAPRTLARRLERSRAGIAPDEISALAVTHEHGDHVAGAGALAEAGVAVYASAGTAQAMHLDGTHAIAAGGAVAIGALELRAVAIPHDAADPLGFVVSDGTCRIGVLTDCGHPAPELASAFAGLDLLVLEANHEPALLHTGPYPAFLKRRIASRVGHLSNEQTADLLIALGASAPRRVVLAHLSRTNNRPPLARAAALRALGLRGARACEVIIAEQDRPLPPIDVAGVVATGPRQLSLFGARP
jgi:phosphoribosyl 1,2-cyclic phosphodiesterase